jgi:cyclopropane fatty-acyl-phospholipid synthase-like methyltransferase
MLQSYVEKAGLADGMKILDLGWAHTFHYEEVLSSDQG